LITVIRGILKKIVKYEFKTDAGIYNFFGLLIFAAIAFGIEVKSIIKDLVWKCFFHTDSEQFNPLYILLMLVLFILLSLGVIWLGEKANKA